jgi:transcriptional regulator with XRE-family HTH domain
MKLKVGHKLQTIREDRKMSQAEFASILAMSPSAYARLERGETQATIDELLRYAESLGVSVNELLPDTLTFHNHNNGKGAGVIFGNYIVNVSSTEQTKILELENERLGLTNKHLQEKIALLEEQVRMLKAMVERA